MRILVFNIAMWLRLWVNFLLRSDDCSVVYDPMYGNYMIYGRNFRQLSKSIPKATMWVRECTVCRRILKVFITRWYLSSPRIICKSLDIEFLLTFCRYSRVLYYILDSISANIFSAYYYFQNLFIYAELMK